VGLAVALVDYAAAVVMTSEWAVEVVLEALALDFFCGLCVRFGERV